MSTRVHKHYTRAFAPSLSFILQNSRFISLHLDTTLPPPPFPLYLPFPTDLQDPSWSSVPQAPHQHLPFQMCSSTLFSQWETGARSLGSAQPAPCTDPGCSATARGYPSPPKQRGCFPANPIPALDYFFCLLGFPSSQHQLAKIHLEFKSKRTPRLHNPAAAAAACA